MKQEFLNRPKFGLSGGKLDDLKNLVTKMRPDVIVFDEVMKPSQNYNLASELKIEVLDRESLILEIFEGRASSTESKMQVKLAQLRYEMSRAREKVRLSKMGEQPGFMGIGKFEVDVYYNDIKHRMVSIKSKLQKAGKQRELHRQSRKRIGFRTISLAGYTSAGKTTLFNIITGERNEEDAKLFTTLTTTIRKFKLDEEWALISDTVGFISKLPAYLIEAFKSTLEELIFTDLIVVVIDATDKNQQLKKKFSSCYKTLMELGVKRQNMVFALNKTESMSDKEIKEKIEQLDLLENNNWIPISAVSGKNIEQLKILIKQNLDSTRKITSNGNQK
jgi:GTP-binding protein HflX|tara:strand:+ start:713 stop:1711 length:999 start_codon:yes stop_codon:yes gene_type:complete